MKLSSDGSAKTLKASSFSKGPWEKPFMASENTHGVGDSLLTQRAPTPHCYPARSAESRKERLLQLMSKVLVPQGRLRSVPEKYALKMEL